MRLGSTSATQCEPFTIEFIYPNLQLLNNYADVLKRGLPPEPATITFFVKQADGSLSQISAELPSNGSLGSLFLAFGLITAEEIGQEIYADSNGSSHDLFEWLSNVASEAAIAADRHSYMKREISYIKSFLLEKYGFESIEIGGEFAGSNNIQQKQLQAMDIVQEALELLAKREGENASGNLNKLEGLKARVYHKDAVPLVTVGFQDLDGTFTVRSEPMSSHVGEDGTLHLVADVNQFVDDFPTLDLDRARLLTLVDGFWQKRSRMLTQALKELLRVENIWLDSRGQNSTEQFVLWAGAILEHGEEIKRLLRGKSYAFNILVHSESGSPLLDFIKSSSVLQVRIDCPPKHLQAFLASEAGSLANESASLIADYQAEEATALEAVKAALGAKQVVRICSSYDRIKVMEATARLLEAAPAIREAIDLTGVSLAIDDCYDIWDSGFVSIPYDFSLADIKPRLQTLLQAPDVVNDSSYGSFRQQVARSNGKAFRSNCVQTWRPSPLDGRGAFYTSWLKPRLFYDRFNLYKRSFPLKPCGYSLLLR